MAPSRGVILLGDVASRTESLAIVCRLCLRRGLLRTDRLLAEHGQNMPMPDLLRLLAAGCPKLDSHSITDRCDVHCPDLVGLFLAAVALGASGAAVKAISISIGETRTSQT
jgi:hypothetical protein